MPQIDIDFTDVPDEIVPLTPGEKVAEITTVPEWRPTKNGQSKNLEVVMEIISPEAEKGRKCLDFINEKMQTKLKRLIKSSGLDPKKGFMTEDLVGKHVKFVMFVDKYKNPETDAVKETTKVKDYII